MARPRYFRLKSPFKDIHVKDFPIADSDLLDHEYTNPLQMGEFVTLDSTYKAVRAANPGVPPGPWAYFAEMGRTDTQAITKIPVLFAGSYWGETKIYNTGAAPALGAKLEVADVTFMSLTRSGLQTHAGGATTTVIGYVTKLADDNGGWLQFQHVAY